MIPQPNEQDLYEVYQAIADITREMVGKEVDIPYYRERFAEMHDCLTRIANPDITTSGELMFESGDKGIRITLKIELYTVGSEDRR